MSTTDPFGTLLGLGFLAWTLWYLAVWLKYGIRDAKTARHNARVEKLKRANELARVLEARAPMPLPVPICTCGRQGDCDCSPGIPSWLPISHDDVLLCLSPGVRADFQKDEPSSSSQ